VKVNFFTFETMEKGSAFTMEFRLTLREMAEKVQLERDRLFAKIVAA